MGRHNVMIAVLVMAMGFVFGAHVVQAVPPLPAGWWGLSTTFDGAPISESDIVTAKDPDGVSCGDEYVWAGPGQYSINVLGEDPDTDGDQGAEDGDTITFFINGYQATVISGSPVWHPAGGGQLELEAFTLTVTSVDPDTIVIGEEDSVITITGTGFWATPTVNLVAGVDTTALTGVTFVNSDSIRATVPAGTPPGTYDVLVTNPDGQSGTVEDGLTVFPPPLEITTTSLPDGAVGVAYSETLSAKGGISPYTWTRTEGSLPEGLTLNADGVIWGTPTTMETQIFTVQVMDSQAPPDTATQELSITIVAAWDAIWVTPSPLDSIVVDTLRHVQSTLQYTATGRMYDGSESDVTSQAVWTGSDAAVATVVAGLASSVSPGEVWIKAAVDGIADSTQLKVAALGDVQCDEDVDGEDARLVVKIIVEKDPYDVPERPTTFEFDAADFMTDNVINVFDVVGIIRHMLDPAWVPPWPKPVFDEEALLVVSKAVVREDGKVNIPIKITTYRPMAAAEVRLRYDPGALSLITPQLTDRTQRMSISYNASEDGELRVVLYSLTGDAMPAGSGPVLHVEFDTRGTKPVQFKVEEILLADEMGRSVPVRTTAVESEAVHAMPTVYALSQNVPNPFNARTTIAFHLPVQGKVHLSIYSLDGQKICSLVDEVRHAGRVSVVWDGKDEAGRAVASGVYFYRLTAGDFVRTKRMVLLK